MMYLYKGLRDKAMLLINSKSTTDDIKAGKDIELINGMINAVNISPEHINDGISLDKKLYGEYPEIQLLCDAANAMQNALGANVKEVIYKTPQETVVDNLTIDYFGILASILINHQVISAIKDFIRTVD